MRAGLRLRGGLESAALALPVGLVLHVLVANALAYVLPVRAAIVLTFALMLLAGVVWLGRARDEPLEWELARPARLALSGLAVLAFWATLALGLAEVFRDDGAHAAMARLLEQGYFPPCSPCNPSLRLAYHYGSDLLVASLIALSGLDAWTAIDVTRALLVLAVLQLAFLAGWRVRRSLGAGLLSVALLATVGQVLWAFAPLRQAPLAGWLQGWPSLVPFLQWLDARALAPQGLFSPHATSPFVESQRSLAWICAPLLLLLFLALREAPLERRRRTLALTLLLGATTLFQSAVLPMLVLALAAALRAWRSRQAEFDWRVVLVAGLLLSASQGGPLRDGLLDRWDGLVAPATAVHGSWVPQLPGCRGQQPSLACSLIALGNLGLAPWLLPWLVLRLRSEGRHARLELIAGALACALATLGLRYDYYDAELSRFWVFALWLLGVLLAPQLVEAAGRGPARRAGALGLVLLLGFGGTVFGLDLVFGAPARAGSFWYSPRAFGLGPLDDQLRPLAARLPSRALVFDPAGCQFGLTTRPAVVLGRYTLAAAERTVTPRLAPAFAALRGEPTAEGFRAAGYTHAYVDAEWLRGLSPQARERLAAEPLELLGAAEAASDYRALLRVCAPREACSFLLPESLSRPSSRAP